MAEVVAGALLSAFLDVLVDRLASPGVINFFRKNESVAEQLEKLNITLWSANALLNDAEEKQIKDGNIKKWVDKLNEVLNEADTVVDEINTESIRQKIDVNKVLPKRLGSMTQRFGAFDGAIKQKIRKIIIVLDLLLDQKDRLGLKIGVPSRSLSRSPAPLIDDPSHAYGRDSDKEALVNKLLFSEKSDGQDKILVIPIVGMGGVGKTTLARLVYNYSRLRDSFEHRAWVTVSHDFDVLKLAKLVLEGLTTTECKVAELGKLGEELKKFLDGKKFFVVLDDIWNHNYSDWNTLKSFFQAVSDGGKIIVTTRSQEIGSMMGSIPSHSLRPMNNDDCWKLFQKHAFRSVKECTEQLETIGIEIVKKCKGLPLAVMSLAGLLRPVSDPNEWKKVMNSDVWEIERKGDDEILPSLWLSYGYLPSNIKRCFGYCSIFPKDYQYDKEKMVLLWMAEGLVQGEDMEDEGEKYFKTLVSRSLLERSATDPSSFVMHDLVHDLATFVLGKDFCMRLGEGDGYDCLTNKTRHLHLGYLGDPNSLSRATSLRTFINSSFMAKVPKKLLSLRVLSRLSIDKVPDSIGKLKHLRYLDLSKSGIRRLPDAICKLHNLQTLLLRGCSSLTHLPIKMDKLINLRHLDISETPRLINLPPCISKMKELRIITKFLVGSGITISELKKFPHLRGCLNICGVENVVNANDVLEAEFKKRSLVTELILEWSKDRTEDAAKDRAILDAFQPHPNLKKLSIKCYGGNEFSSWVADHSFSNVTELSLEHCKHCFQLASFGQLPALKNLKVSRFPSVEKIGSEFYGPSDATPFPSLKILKIASMNKLQSWSFEAEGAFRCLEELILEDCPKLNTIGLDSSHCLPSLKTLSIWKCRKLEFRGLPLPSSLKELNISDCQMVSQRVQWGLKALTKLTIRGCKNVDLFPDDGLLPTTLTRLGIGSFSNLKSLNGKAFQLLTSLKQLAITGCPNLLSLPEEKLPASLEYLCLIECSETLKARLEREKGEDWNKISHIPTIRLR